MRIGFNAHLLNLSQSYRNAGVGRYIYYLLREYARRQYDTASRPDALILYADVDPADAARAFAMNPEQEIALPPRWTLRRPAWPTIRPPLRIGWEQAVLPLRGAIDRLDLLHAPVNVVPLAATVPTVVTIHDLSFLLFPDRFVPAKRRYLTAFTQATVARAQHIIAVSENTRADVIRLLHVDPARVSTVYEGVEERFTPASVADLATFRQRHNLPEHMIVHVGTLEPRKNLGVLIRAYARLRDSGIVDGRHDWPLVLAGGKGWLYDDIFRLVQELRLDEMVRFPGYVSDEELPLWYSAASLFVVPSTYEGFGLPLLEAMACGATVVSSTASSLPEVVGDAGIVVNCTVEDILAEQLERLIGDHALRADLAQRAQRRAARFTWSHTANDTLAVYQRVLHSR